MQLVLVLLLLNQKIRASTTSMRFWNVKYTRSLFCYHFQSRCHYSTLLVSSVLTFAKLLVENVSVITIADAGGWYFAPFLYSLSLYRSAAEVVSKNGWLKPLRDYKINLWFFFSGVRSNLVLSGVFAPHIHFVVCVSKLQVGIATHPNLKWKTTGNVWTVLKIKPPVPTITTTTTPSIATVEHERHAIVSLLCCAPNNDLPQTLKLRPHHSTKENGNNSGYQQQKQKKTGQRKETNTLTKWG